MEAERGQPQALLQLQERGPCLSSLPFSHLPFPLFLCLRNPFHLQLCSKTWRFYDCRNSPLKRRVSSSPSPKINIFCYNCASPTHFGDVFFHPSTILVLLSFLIPPLLFLVSRTVQRYGKKRQNLPLNPLSKEGSLMSFEKSLTERSKNSCWI